MAGAQSDPELRLWRGDIKQRKRKGSAVHRAGRVGRSGETDVHEDARQLRTGRTEEQGLQLGPGQDHTCIRVRRVTSAQRGGHVPPQ